MDWSLRDIKDKLKCYFSSESFAWSAEFDEEANGVDVDGNGECNSIYGVAADVDGDGNAEMFFYEKKYPRSMVSLFSKNIERYLKPYCGYLKHDDRAGPALCETSPGDISFKPFPFKGGILPDSYGKITAITFGIMDDINDVFIQFTQQVSELDIHVFHMDYERAQRRIPGSYYYWQILGRLFYSGNIYFNTTNIMWTRAHIWMQDRLLAGINEYGETIIPFPGPVDSTFGAGTVLAKNMENTVGYVTDYLLEGGDVVSSSASVFIHDKDSRYHDVVGDNFMATMVGDRALVVIDEIPGGAAHLDMIITPTEVKLNGKEVVFLAEAVDELKREDYFRNVDKSSRVLNDINERLSSGYMVVRLPYVHVHNNKNPDIPIQFSYNNVLMENYEDDGGLVKRVYVPFYDGLEKYNELARTTYEQFGYEVVPIEHMNRAAEFGGGLRCLIKVLKRRYIDLPK